MKERSPAAASPDGAELLELLGQLGREKGIGADVLVSALEDAITTASRKAQERIAGAQETLISRLDRRTGAIFVLARKRVVETVTDPAVEIALADARRVDPSAEPGGYVDLPRSTKGLGRIEAQAAKQIISQKVREAERDNVFAEYAPRVGQLLNATVKRFERGDVVLDLGRTEAVLPRRYQSRAEMFAVGDRVRAVIVEVTRAARGPQVVVSRIDPLLVVRLFEMEVPEVDDGTVTLRQAVREAGERTKVAVSSRHADVDAVGACVGLKGSRVQAIIRELRGEKIDIVPWADEVTQLAANALNPAKVARVRPGPGPERVLEAIVDAQQLSLAIGKKGQNVRLAARLAGCRIDIRSEEDCRREAESRLCELGRRARPLAEVPELAGDPVLAALAGAGLRTAGDLADAAADRLGAQTGLGEIEARRLIEAARAFLAAPPAGGPPPPPTPGESAAARA